MITRIFNWHLPLTPIKQLFSALISFISWFQVGLRMGKLLSKQVRRWGVWWCLGSVRVQGGKPKLQAWEILLWYVTSFLISLSAFSCPDWSGALRWWRRNDVAVCPQLSSSNFPRNFQSPELVAEKFYCLALIVTWVQLFSFQRCTCICSVINSAINVKQERIITFSNNPVLCSRQGGPRRDFLSHLPEV